MRSFADNGGQRLHVSGAPIALGSKPRACMMYGSGTAESNPYLYTEARCNVNLLNFRTSVCPGV